MKYAIISLALLGVPAYAESKAHIKGTTIELQETSEPEAILELEFFNRSVNGPDDTQTFELEYRSVKVKVDFIYRAGADSIGVDPGPGLRADPPHLSVEEGRTGYVYIYPEQFLGM